MFERFAASVLMITNEFALKQNHMYTVFDI